MNSERHGIRQRRRKMPWRRQRRLLCVICLASCESIVSSFGVGTGNGLMTKWGRLVRGGASSNDLSMTGLQDGSYRKGLPAVQATAGTASPVVAPSSLEEGGAVAEGTEPKMMVPPPPERPPKLPSIQDGESWQRGTSLNRVGELRAVVLAPCPTYRRR